MSAKVVVALRVRATPQRAFDAFTREIALWWKPNTLFRFTPREPGVIGLEPGEGGRLTETLANGKVFEIGKVRAWEPPHRLVVGWRQAFFAEGQDTEVEVGFEPVGAETRVTVTHTGWDSVPQESVARHGFPLGVFLQRHGEWWQTLLTSLRQRVEEDAA
jgi:uncharacterized protein YndB with AHSA1/START domain